MAIPRHLAPRLLAALRDTPAVLLAGGRQTGKTTLARAIGDRLGARYVSLDDVTPREAARADPTAFLAELRGPAVLDEVQQVPELFPALRRRIDADRAPGRFLLTGSAHVLAVPEIARALVGRMELRTLWPLSQGELDGVREGFLDGVFADRLPPVPAGEDRESSWRRALRGGFPEVVAREEGRRGAWIDAYVELLLARDVRDLSRIEGLALLPRLLELLAARSGTLLNVAELSRSAGLPQSTLKRYLALLEAVFLLVRIPAWAANPTKRLAKAPKAVLTDAGLLARIARTDAEGVRERPELAGRVLESFVAMELRKQVDASAAPYRLHHLRTAAGREVDLVVEDPRGRLVGVEVKSATSVVRADFRGIDALADAAGERLRRGVVLHLGEDATAFGPDRHALPLSALWRMGARPVAEPVPAPEDEPR